MPCGQGLLARSEAQATDLGLAFKIAQRADLPIGSLAPGRYGDLGHEEIAVPGGRRFGDAASEFAAFA